jgi:hypothetical protein
MICFSYCVVPKVELGSCYTAHCVPTMNQDFIDCEVHVGEDSGYTLLLANRLPSYEITTHRYGQGHYYEMGGKKVPTVTQIASHGLDPAILEGWKKKKLGEATRYVQARYSGRVLDDELMSTMALEIEARYQMLTHVGDRVHAFAESIMKDEPYEIVYPEDELFVTSFKQFRADVDLRPLAVEVPVGSLKHKYAGRLDFLAVVGDRVCIVDIKSGSGVFDSHHRQVAGYSIALTEMYGYPQHDGLILHLKPDGYDLVEVNLLTAIPQFLEWRCNYKAEKGQ